MEGRFLVGRVVDAREKQLAVGEELESVVLLRESSRVVRVAAANGGEQRRRLVDVDAARNDESRALPRERAELGKGVAPIVPRGDD
jgi:hypothetical protein